MLLTRKSCQLIGMLRLRKKYTLKDSYSGERGPKKGPPLRFSQGNIKVNFERPFQLLLRTRYPVLNGIVNVTLIVVFLKFLRRYI